jgi:hypothetical protein
MVTGAAMPASRTSGHYRRACGRRCAEPPRMCPAKSGSSDPVTCELGVAQSATTIVLMGDSHAMMYVPALRPVAIERGWRLVTLVKSACPPTLGVISVDQHRLDGGRTCDEWRRNALARLAADPPRHIIIAHSDNYKIVDGDGRVLPPKRRPQAWKDGLRRTLAALPASTRAIVLGDVPSNSGNPVICLKSNKGDISACVTPRESRGQRSIEVALRQAAVRKGATFRTLYGKVCTYDPCPLVHGDVLMWRDGGHLTATFMTSLIPAVRQLMAVTVASSTGRPSRR